MIPAHDSARAKPSRSLCGRSADTVRGSDQMNPQIVARSLAQHGDDDAAGAGASIAFKMNDLLPGAQHRPAVGDRNRQRRPQHRGLKM